MSQRAMSIDNISFLSPPMSKPLQYENDREGDGNYSKDEIDYNDNYSESPGNVEMEQTRLHMEDDELGDDENNIIPWKKLLRKTNSRLSLIS